MAEPTPGAPGGSSGPRSATAATFVVNDSSLKTLHKTFRDLIKDVNDFNTALQGLSKGSKTLESVQAKLGALGVAGTGSSSNGTLHPGQTTRVGDGRAPNGGDSTTSARLNEGSHGEGGGGRGKGLTPGRVIGGAVVGTIGAAGSFYNRSMGDMSDLDLMYNQLGQGMGGGYSRAKYTQARQFLTGTGDGSRGIGGYTSASDLQAGVQNIQGALGGGIGSQRTQTALQQAGRLAALNPSMGLGGSTAAVASLYAPQTQQRMRSLGITPMGSQGRMQSPGATYAAIQRTVFRGQKVTANMINEGLAPGAPLMVTLQAMGLDQNAISQFQQYAIAQSNLGGDAARTDKALKNFNEGNQTADVKRAGFNDSMRSAQNTLGGAKTRQISEAGAEGKDAIQGAFGGLAHVTDQLTDSFRALNQASGGASGRALGYSPFLAGPVKSVLGSVGGVGGALFSAQSLKGIIGGGMSGGLRGALKGGAKGALGASGMLGTPVYVTNMGDGGGFGGGVSGLGPNDTGAMHGPPMSRAMRLKRMIPTAEEMMPLLRFVVPLAIVAGTVALIKNAHDAQIARTDARFDATMASGGASAVHREYDRLKAADRNPHTIGSSRRKYLRKKGVVDEYKRKLDGVPDTSDSGPGEFQFHSVYDEGQNTPTQFSYGLSGGGGAAAPVGGGGNIAKSTKPVGSSTTISGIINTAESFLGRPYQWGGSNPRTSFDCSGLTQWSYGSNGIKIPRTAQEQQKVGTAVDPKNMVPGDLMFYGNPAHHVTMYLGNGQMVEAPHTGAFIHNTAARTPDGGVRRIVGGGAGFSGVALPTSPGSSDGRGDRGNAPAGTGPGLNIAGGGGGFGDEMSALASVLAAPSLIGGGASGFAGSSSRHSGGTAGAASRRSGSGPVAQVGSMPAGSAATNAAIIVHVAKQMGLSKRGAIIGIATAEQESNLINLHSGDRDSQGLFQQRPSQGWGTVAQVTNPAYAARSFFSRLKNTDYNNLPLTVAAQMVQRSGFPNAYAKWESTATGIVNKIGYRKGSWDVDRDEVASVHAGEMIVPAAVARRARTAIAHHEATSRLSPGGSSGTSGTSGSVNITIHAPISLVGRATPADAKEFLRMVKDHTEQDLHLDIIGRG